MNLKEPSKIAADDTYFSSKKIRFDVHVSPVAEDSHEISSYFL